MPTGDAQELGADDARALSMRVGKIASVLEATLGRPEIRPHGPVLDALIGTILSQSTTGRNSSRAFESLRSAFPEWGDALAAGAGPIRDAIRSGGLAAQKSVRIHRLLARVAEETGDLSLEHVRGWPDDEVYEWLGSFEGVGVKTVAVLLLFACGRDVCPVDTHVHRICRRLSVVRERASADETFRALQPVVPAGSAGALHMSLIAFGRTRCRSQSPKCDGCPLGDECGYDPSSGTIGS